MKDQQEKYQVNVKPTGAKKADPSKHKNFEQVYNKYTHWVYRNPWHRFQFHKSKNRKITMYILLILIVAALVAMEYLAEKG